jgi:Fic family protein
MATRGDGGGPSVKDGNGRTARVLAWLAMYRAGFRHPAFTSLEEWWGRYPRQYYEAFVCLGRVFDRSADVTPFMVLGLALRASLDDAREHARGLTSTVAPR